MQNAEKILEKTRTINIYQYVLDSKSGIVRNELYEHLIMGALYDHGKDTSLTQKTLIAKIHVIAGSYVETRADSLLSVRIKNDTIEVIGRQKKKPFFSYYGSWAYSYETDDYKVVFDSSGCSYFLQFKKKIFNVSIINRSEVG